MEGSSSVVAEKKLIRDMEGSSSVVAEKKMIRDMEGSSSVVAEKKLYDAASAGDTSSLQELLNEDALLLNKVSFTCPNKTPLHLATIHGHLPFVIEILNLNPRLAEELDSQQSSPLHIASAKGYLDIVKKLLAVAPDMCLSRDCQGRNPFHLSAMKGHIEVLNVIIEKVPHASHEKDDQHNTVLHLCVKHGQLAALTMLLPNVIELLHEENGDGDTILHMAVRNRQSEIIEHLVKNSNMDVNTKNSKGQTPIYILSQNPNDPRNSAIIDIITPKLHNTQTQPKSLNQKRDAIMVVAILIATMAFQAGVSPPGGVLQENITKDAKGKPLRYPHWTGESIIAHRHPIAYKHFFIANTMAFISSIVTILLLINGLPLKKRTVFMRILRVIMSLSLTSITATYVIAIFVVTPKRRWNSVAHVIEHGLGLALWCVVMGVIIVWNIARLIRTRLLKNKGINENI